MKRQDMDRSQFIEASELSDNADSPFLLHKNDLRKIDRNKDGKIDAKELARHYANEGEK